MGITSGYFGFDCAHCIDYPTTSDGIYKDYDFVLKYIKNMIDVIDSYINSTSNESKDIEEHIKNFYDEYEEFNKEYFVWAQLRYSDCSVYWIPITELSFEQLTKLKLINNQQYGMGHGRQTYIFEVINSDWLNKLEIKYQMENKIESLGRIAKEIIILYIVE
jgi:hypothetical protein